jgi:hypothetical protein
MSFTSFRIRSGCCKKVDVRFVPCWWIIHVFFYPYYSFRLCLFLQADTVLYSYVVLYDQFILVVADSSFSSHSRSRHLCSAIPARTPKPCNVSRLGVYLIPYNFAPQQSTILRCELPAIPGHLSYRLFIIKRSSGK